jgi:hypothetical protein
VLTSPAAGRFPHVNEVGPPFRQLERHRVELLLRKVCEKERGGMSSSIQNTFHFWEAIFLVLGNRHLEMLKGTESERLLGGVCG